MGCVVVVVVVAVVVMIDITADDVILFIFCN